MTDKIKSYSKYLPYIILAALGMAIYFNTLFNGYIYDDYQLILDDFRIKDIKYIPHIFSSSEWSFSGVDVINNYYRPLYVLIFMVEWHIFADQIWGWHLTNIIFHIISSFIVFLLFKTLLADDNEQGSAGDKASPIFSTPTLAFMGSLIFLTHPVITESVAWASAMSELSFSLFYLLSFYLYIKSQNEKSRKLYAASIISFLLAAFAKETAMTLPVLIVAFDLFIKKRNLIKQIPLYIPFAVVGVFYLTLRIIVLEGMAPKTNMHPYLSTYQYILNVFPLIMDYMRTLLLPVKLLFFHDFNPVYSILEPRAIAALIVVPLVFIIFIIARKRKTLYLLPLLIFFIPLLPTFYIPVLSRDPFTERYLYLPSVGFALISLLILKTVAASDITSSHKRKRIITVVFLILIAVYSYGTITRTAEWKNITTLLEASVRKDPANYYPLYELGINYKVLGRINDAQLMLERSVKANSSRRNPDPKLLGLSRLRLAEVYYELGNLESSLTQYKELFRVAPKRFDVNMGIALVYHKKGDLELATLHYENALRFVKDPEDALGIYINLGNVHTAAGRLNKAMENYLKAREISPDEPIIINNIEVIKRRMQRK